MKKLLFLAGFYCVHFSSHAQDLSLKNPPSDHQVVLSDNRSSHYDRAQRHFSHNYPGSQGTRWTTLAGSGFVCSFKEEEIVNHAHYDKRGNWICTVVGYPAERLQQEVRDVIQGSYPGYRITYVNQINSRAPAPVYFINIESWSDIKVIKVIGEEIELRQELRKE